MAVLSWWSDLSGEHLPEIGAFVHLVVFFAREESSDSLAVPGTVVSLALAMLTWVRTTTTTQQQEGVQRHYLVRGRLSQK